MADGCYTNRNMTTGMHTEDDPVARPFITHGAGLRAAYFTGALGLDLLASYELDKHGHRKLAKLPLIFGIVLNAEGAASSAAHFNVAATK